MHESMERLYSATKTLHGRQGTADVARLLDQTTQTVQNWEERGVSQGGALMAQLKHGISATWILNGEGAMTISPLDDDGNYKQGVSADKYVEVRMLQNEYGAGSSAVLLEYDEIDGQRAYRRDWLEKYGFDVKYLRVVPVKGDSMIPYVFDGNHVLINTLVTRIVDGEHYAIQVGREPKIKRLFSQSDGRIRIESYNAPTDYINPGDDARVIGMVIDRNGTSWRGGRK